MLIFFTGYRFAGVEFGRECWCGNSYSSDLPELSDQHCNMPCSGDASKTCGGYLAIDIYHTGYGCKYVIFIYH